MGERSRWIADLDALPDEAPDLADRILTRLVDAGIVLAERTDCVLGDVPGGYAPGPAAASAAMGDPAGFPDVWPNGLEIDVGRGAYYGTMREDDRVRCPRCGAWLPFETVLDAVEEWLEGGPDALVCARCGERTGFNGWRWPVPCAFAELGLRFWNWPPLADGFVASVASALDHRVVAGSCGT